MLRYGVRWVMKVFVPVENPSVGGGEEVRGEVVTMVLYVTVLFSRIGVTSTTSMGPSNAGADRIALSSSTGGDGNRMLARSAISSRVGNAARSRSGVSRRADRGSGGSRSRSSNKGIGTRSASGVSTCCGSDGVYVCGCRRLGRVNSSTCVCANSGSKGVNSKRMMGGRNARLGCNTSTRCVLVGSVRVGSRRV